MSFFITKNPNLKKKDFFFFFFFFGGGGEGVRGIDGWTVEQAQINLSLQLLQRRGHNNVLCTSYVPDKLNL